MKKLILLVTTCVSGSLLSVSNSDYFNSAWTDNNRAVATSAYFQLNQQEQASMLPKFKAKFGDPVKPGVGFDFGSAKTNSEKVAVIIKKDGVLDQSIGAMAKSNKPEDKKAVDLFQNAVANL